MIFKFQFRFQSDSTIKLFKVYGCPPPPRHSCLCRLVGLSTVFVLTEISIIERRVLDATLIVQVLILNWAVPIFLTVPLQVCGHYFPPLKVTARFSLCQSFCCRIADRMWNLCLADWYRLNRWIHFGFTVTVLWFVQKKVCKCLCSFRQQPFQMEWHLSMSFVIPLSWILIYNLIGVRESGLYLRGVSPLLGCFLLLWALLVLALQWLCGHIGMSWIFPTYELCSSEE